MCACRPRLSRVSWEFSWFQKCHLKIRFWLQAISAEPRLGAPSIMAFRQLHIRCSLASQHLRIFQCWNPTAYQAAWHQYIYLFMHASICISPLKADPIHIPCMHKNIALAFSIILIYKSTIAVQNAFTWLTQHAWFVCWTERIPGWVQTACTL